MAKRIKISMVRGDSRSYNLSFTTSGTSGTGAYDLTGWAIVFTAKQDANQPDSEAAIRIIVPAAGTAGTHGTAGTSKLNFEPSDTAALDPMDYEFDLQLINSEGITYTPLMGVLTLEQDVGTSGTAGTAGT